MISNLRVGHVTHGEVATKAWIVYEVQGHPAGSNFRLHFTKYTGDLYVVVRRLDSPTILAPPYVYIDAGTETADVDVCATGDEIDYVGLYGGAQRAVYKIEMEQIDAASCFRFGVDDAADAYDDDVVDTIMAELHTGQRVLASCEPFQWADFSLAMTGSGLYNDNLIFQVLAIDAETNPTALEVYLYENNIPDDRDSQHFATTAVDGIYSIGVSSIHTTKASAPDNYLLGVRCQTLAVQFSVVVARIPGTLKSDDHIYATICPNSFVYFQHRVTEAHVNARVSVVKYRGDLSFILRREQVPVRLIYPYATLESTDHKSDMSLCDIEAVNTPIWIGVSGGDHCASFFINLEYFYDADCSEERNAVPASQSTASSSSFVELPLYQFHYASCEANAWSSYSLTFSSCPGDNVQVHVEQFLEDRIDPEALTVYAVHLQSENATADVDFEKDYDAISASAISNIHSITFNYVDVMYIVPADAKNRRNFAIGIKCGNANTRYRVSVTKVNAELADGRLQTGVLCAEAWLYHYYNAGGATFSHDCVDVANASSTSSIGNDGAVADGKPHLRFTIRLFKGNLFFIAARDKFPPAFNSRPHHLAELAASDVPTAIDSVQEVHIDVCDVPHESIYIGLYVSTECAIYDIAPTRFDGTCQSTFSRI